jgi:hypothetical protein
MPDQFRIRIATWVCEPSQYVETSALAHTENELVQP